MSLFQEYCIVWLNWSSISAHLFLWAWLSTLLTEKGRHTSLQKSLQCYPTYLQVSNIPIRATQLSKTRNNCRSRNGKTYMWNITPKIHHQALNFHRMDIWHHQTPTNFTASQGFLLSLPYIHFPRSTTLTKSNS